LKRISFISTLLLAFLISFSQKQGKITVKKQNQLFFYRLSNDTSKNILQNSSDQFLINMSEDYKDRLVFLLTNASFVKTEKENIYTLIHMPGVNYKASFPILEKSFINSKQPAKNPEFSHLLKMEINGASTNNRDEIIIEILDTKTDKFLLSNHFTYSKK